MEEPVVIWLSGLHIPESYLIAHIQAACRASARALDRSSQYTRVTAHTSPDDIEERPQTVSPLTYCHSAYTRKIPNWHTSRYR